VNIAAVRSQEPNRTVGVAGKPKTKNWTRKDQDWDQAKFVDQIELGHMFWETEWTEVTKFYAREAQFLAE
jgi:hypothetical protein